MKTTLLSVNEILEGYDAISKIYPPIPPLYIWRAWEFYAYRRYCLREPVLDIGCGDGSFFHLAWPNIKQVAGVDIDPATVNRARQSGFYSQVLETPAHRLPFPPDRFHSAIANCSLEHMDLLPEVLRSLHRCLAPKGTFLFSVVTEKLREWSPLPLLLDLLGDPENAHKVERNYADFHHYRNVFAPPVWVGHMEDAGFRILEHTPIVPEMTARLFLFFDKIWHIPYLQGECGDVLVSRFTEIPRFRELFRQIFSAVLQMEKNWSLGAGAIFWTQKP